jgi:hypothetical protein
MTSVSWLDELRPLGALPPAEAARALRAIGESDVADELDEVAEAGGSAAYGSWRVRLRRDPVWRHTSHVVGHIPAHQGGTSAVTHAAEVEPDERLCGQQLKVTLDRLRVADYPGHGIHHILFDFAVQNQTEQGPESVHFNALYRVAEGDHAPVAGRPIFVGLRVGGEGLFLQCATVNVKNESDEALLGFLDSDAFKTGLQLVATAQPALAPLSVMALSLTKAMAARNHNVTVQTIELGMDFSRISTRPRLAEGSYIAVQVPEPIAQVWRWADWVFDPAVGMVTRRDDASPIPYNYLVLGVSRQG